MKHYQRWERVNGVFHVKQVVVSAPRSAEIMDVDFLWLTDEQNSMLGTYVRLLVRYNQKVNLISREDEGRVALHVRHALSLAVKGFPPESMVVDWGTGGGLPAVPLAICFPEVRFCAVDSVEKKTMALQAMVRRLGLRNLDVWNGRAEAWPGGAHYSISRATAPLLDLWRWHTRVSVSADASAGGGFWTPGLVCLKGGALGSEVESLRRAYPSACIVQHPLQSVLGEAYFADKCIVTVTL